MRIFLSFLLCFVFLEVQTFAQDDHIAANGGPNYGSLGSITGTYSGTLVPTSSVTNTSVTTLADIFVVNQGIEQEESTNNSTTTNATGNAVGLFSVSVPTTNIGTGVFLFFSGQSGVLNITGGLTFTGNIAVIADPTTQKVAGVLSGIAPVSVTTTTSGSGLSSTDTTYNDTVEGSLTATIGQSSNSSAGASALSGSAFLEIVAPPITQTNPNDTVEQVTTSVTNITLTVDGFQQSTSTSSPSTPQVLGALPFFL